MNYWNTERILHWEETNVKMYIVKWQLDDPLFVGIEKVVARIVSNQCNNNNLNLLLAMSIMIFYFISMQSHEFLSMSI